jgi:NAD(P)-dependent dehydrogenase (short-subunit alcohol dehydrogenase family)
MADVLEGQVAIVSGGGRGIGFAIAQALGAAGAAVALIARSEAELHAAASTVRSMGSRALPLPADVTDGVGVRQVVEQTERELGPVTLLVNNAGTPGSVGPDWEVDAAEWWRCIEVSVRGAFLCTQAVLPLMLARGSGRIINVASLTGVRPRPFLTGTSVAKTALIRFAEGLAAETQDRGIQVFAIHPGAVRTDMIAAYLQAPTRRSGCQACIGRQTASGRLQNWLAGSVCAWPRAVMTSCLAAFSRLPTTSTTSCRVRRSFGIMSFTCCGCDHNTPHKTQRGRGWHGRDRPLASWLHLTRHCT